jgi:hypothetical protein
VSSAEPHVQIASSPVALALYVYQTSGDVDERPHVPAMLFDAL